MCLCNPTNGSVLRLAKEEGKRAFGIFSPSVQREMSQRLPPDFYVEELKAPKRLQYKHHPDMSYNSFALDTRCLGKTTVLHIFTGKTYSGLNVLDLWKQELAQEVRSLKNTQIMQVGVDVNSRGVLSLST